MIAIIDADLLGRKSQRFPNLALMKISSYLKSKGNDVRLILNYDELKLYDVEHIYMSKVFEDTIIPDEIFMFDNITYGGTGFYYDKAPFLISEIEHSKPDYNLYNEFVEREILNGVNKNKLKYYTDYSIGFYTRGCFRKCEFCVNKNYDRVSDHSKINEWYDSTKKKICLLDDNFFGYSDWKEKLIKLKELNVSFQFKQGLDIRLMTDEKAEILSKCKYDGDFIFAFDNIKDKEIISKKLELWREYTKKTTKLYVFCGFDRNGKYDLEFEKQDFIDLFERIKILMKNKCLPYIMRFKKYEELKHRGMYINIARWCNQPNFFLKKSLMEWIEADTQRNNESCSSNRYFELFKSDFPDLVEKYFNLKYEED